MPWYVATIRAGNTAGHRCHKPVFSELQRHYITVYIFLRVCTHTLNVYGVDGYEYGYGYADPYHSREQPYAPFTTTVEALGISR